MNDNAQRRGPLAALDAFLTSPFAGIAPWAVLSILSAPGRFQIAAGAALGFSVLVMVVGLARGIKVHLLEVFGAAVLTPSVGAGRPLWACQSPVSLRIAATGSVGWAPTDNQ